MEITPYSQSLLYLKRLQEDIYESQLSDRKRQENQNRQTDINLLCFGQGQSYIGLDENIKTHLLVKGYIAINKSKHNSDMLEISLTEKGNMFLNQYNSFFGRWELRAKDYPFIIGGLLFGMLGGITSFIAIELIRLLTK